MTTTSTTYDLSVRIVGEVDNQGLPCKHCQDENATVQCQAYITLGDDTIGVETMLDACLACLIPALDSAPYLDTDSVIVVEVARSATNRPF